MSAASVGDIEIQSGVSASTGEGFCRVVVVLDDGTQSQGQMTPDEARSMAMGWLQAAEAAEHDAAVFAELTDGAGLTLEVAGHFLLGLRARRAAGADE